MENIGTVTEYFLRILLAGICGGILGYERKHRGKGAGIRTHIIVAISSALMMLVSKYGFDDLVFGEEFRLDPSRVASQIVSGVGFLGAGMIFIQKKTVQGLTTAAGIWATSGIGMAIGSGMYSIGVITSLVILFVQFFTHKGWKFLQGPLEETIVFVLADSDEAMTYFKDYLKKANIEVGEMQIKKGLNSTVEVKVTATLPVGFDVTELLDLSREYVCSVDL